MNPHNSFRLLNGSQSNRAAANNIPILINSFRFINPGSDDFQRGSSKRQVKICGNYV